MDLSNSIFQSEIKLLEGKCQILAKMLKCIHPALHAMVGSYKGLQSLHGIFHCLFLCTLQYNTIGTWKTVALKKIATLKSKASYKDNLEFFKVNKDILYEQRKKFVYLYCNWNESYLYTWSFCSSKQTKTEKSYQKQRYFCSKTCVIL